MYIWTYVQFTSTDEHRPFELRTIYKQLSIHWGKTIKSAVTSVLFGN